MSDQFDDLDRQLRSLARAARHEAAVGPADTEQALAEVTSGTQLTRLRPVETPEPARRWQPWVAVAAATALIVTGGIWLATRGDDQVRSVDPTVPQPEPSMAPAEPLVPPTSASNTASTSPPPPAVGPRDPFAGLTRQATEIERVCHDGTPACTWLLADPDGVVYSCDPRDATVTRHAVPELTAKLVTCPSAIGPGAVAYSFEPQADGNDDLVARALGPDEPGVELRRSPDWNLADSDLVPVPAGLAMVGLVMPPGPQPDLTQPPAMEWVLPEPDDARSFPVGVFEPGDQPAIVVGDSRWVIGEHFSAPVTAVTGIVATDDGGFLALVDDQTGSSLTLLRGMPDGGTGGIPLNDDFAAFTPALLERAGTVLVPDGDTFVRVDPLEAFTPTTDVPAPTEPPPPTSTSAPTTAPATDPAVPPLNDALLAGLYFEGSGIDNVCVEEGPCTQVVFDPSGAAVSYDPSTRAVTWHGRDGATDPFVVPGTQQASLLAAGPDRVVYIRVASDDPELDSVAAHSANPGDQWREIASYPGVLGLGDYDVVPSPAGLVTVGWYGQGFQPESPEPVIEWAGRDGQPVTSPQPLVRMDYYEIAVEIGNRTWSFDDPVNGAHPSRPPITPTFDGGFIAVLHHGADGSSAVVRGWSDGTVDTWYPPADAGPWISVIPEPSGYVLVPHGDTFMRAELFPARPGDYWDGERTIDVEAGTMTAVGLNEFLDANDPWWETDPIGLANAVAGPVSSPAERRAVEFRDDAVVVATENHLDDSVYGTRLTLLLVADEGGPRIHRIDWANTCQPGRGHQDYQAALCT